MPKNLKLRRRVSSYLKSLENPYAWLSVADDETLAQVTGTTADRAVLRGISKAEFRNGCTRIFRRYVPAVRRGRIEDSHREFIAQNETRSPPGRAHVLAALKRYDLSPRHRLQGQFNRALPKMGNDKLRAIEIEADAFEASNSQRDKS